MEIKIFSVAFLVLVSSGLIQSQQIDPIKKVLIDALVERSFIPLNHVSALSLAIVDQSGQTLYTRGYGHLNIEDNIEAQNNTLFGIGSISKSFTAVIVTRTLNRLYPEYGEAVLDIPVAKLLPPGEKFVLVDRFRSEYTTFRDLLSHRICIMPESIGITIMPYANQSDFLYRQRYAEEVCPVRTNMVYHNGMIVVAGDLIGILANKTFNTMMGELFTELGMSDTRIIRETDDFQNMPTLSQVYYYREGRLRKFNEELLKKVAFAPGSGGVLSSAVDMARYMDFHLNFGNLDGVQIVPEEVMKWIHIVAAPTPNNIGKTEPNDMVTGDFGYGLGMFLGLFDGWQYSHHGGYLPPYFSYMSLYPGLKLGIFSSASGPGILPTQTDHVNFLHPQIYGILRETNVMQMSKSLRMSGQLEIPFATPWKSNGNALGLQDKSKLKVKVEPGCAEGLYGHPTSGELHISHPDGAGGDAYLQYGYWGTGYLRNTSTAGLYLWEADSDIVHEFYAEEVDAVVEIFIDCRFENYLAFVKDGYEFVYEKGLSLDKLPEIPWAPESCGPEN